jgi:aryl-alcohol dehydrogenase-like predicted oxidoreductase
MWQPIEPQLLAIAQANGVGIVAWSPLGGGFLTGSVAQVADGDYRNNVPRFVGANLQVNTDRYRPVRDLAEEWGITPGQLALAWLLHQSPSVVPIPGSRTPAHIDENIAAASLSLDAGALARVDAALAAFQPVGATMFERSETR